MDEMKYFIMLDTIFSHLDVGPHPGGPLRLLHGVGLRLEGVQPPLVGLGLNVGLESVCVNKVFSEGIKIISITLQ